MINSSRMTLGWFHYTVPREERKEVYKNVIFAQKKGLSRF